MRSGRRENSIDRASRDEMNHRYFMGGCGKVTAIQKNSQTTIRSDHIYYASIGDLGLLEGAIG
jgi:hypothetical protein